MLALKLLQQAVEWNAGHFLLWLELGQCQQALGLVGPAEHSFTQAQQLNPQCHEADLALMQNFPKRTCWRAPRGWLRRLIQHDEHTTTWTGCCPR